MSGHEIRLSQLVKWQGCHWTWCFLGGYTRWHSPQILLHDLLSLLVLGLIQITALAMLGMASCGGRGKMCRSLTEPTEVHLHVRNLCVHGEKRCGVHCLLSCKPKWRWYVKLSSNTWHLSSEDVEGLWAWGSITALHVHRWQSGNMEQWKKLS